MNTNLPVLIVIIPLMSSFIMPVVGLIRRRYCHILSFIATSAVFILAIMLIKNVTLHGTLSYHLGNWEPPWGIEYVIDNLGAYMAAIIAFIGLSISVYSKKSIEKELNKNLVFYYTLHMLLLTGLLGIVVTGDIFNLYVFLEISSLSAYALIALGEKRQALTASFKYLILGTIAASFILIGIGFLYAVTGTLNMADMSLHLEELYGSRVVHAAAVLIVVGLSIKIALFPLHSWLPNAYTHAPSTVSALIAALMSKVGAYMMIRLLYDVFTINFFIETMPVGEILSWTAAIAIIAGSISAIAQKNIKRMLAYSSISQIGYIVLGIGLANTAGLTGSLLHILNHALMKGCLFLAVGAIIYKTGIKNIGDFNGLGKKMPYTMAFFAIASLSMVGVPPLCGFFSKWYLALGSIEAGRWIFALVILSSSLLNAGYFFRVLEKAYFGEQNKIDKTIAPASMLIPMLVLAAACIVFGILVYMILPYVQYTAISLIQ
ncbi:MAG: cation:proton antiporter [Candidatus Altiarchaeales archaeon ex4484_96]|nr:MAG: cation:proton antiporter [Candidatus Altiarchaeales archaeon ex4484_96]